MIRFFKRYWIKRELQKTIEAIHAEMAHPYSMANWSYINRMCTYCRALEIELAKLKAKGKQD